MLRNEFFRSALPHSAVCEAGSVARFAVPRLALALGALACFPVTVGFFGNVSLSAGIVALLLAIQAMPAVLALRRGTMQGLYSPAIAIVPFLVAALCAHSLALAFFALLLCVFVVLEGAALGLGVAARRLTMATGGIASVICAPFLSHGLDLPVLPVLAATGALVLGGAAIAQWIARTSENVVAERNAAQERLSLQADLMQEPLIWVSPTGHVTTANCAAITRFGRAVGQGDDFLKVLHPVCRSLFMKTLAESLRCAVSVPVTLRMAPDGDWNAAPDYHVVLRAAQAGASEICVIMREAVVPDVAVVPVQAVPLENAAELATLAVDGIATQNVLHLAVERRLLEDGLRSGGLIAQETGVRKRA